MTSNVGAELIRKGGSLGFLAQEEEVSYEKMKENLLEKVKHTFKPEFLNRIDDIIVFRPLSKDKLSKIVDLEIGYVNERLKEREITLQVDEDARKLLVEKGFDPAFGARPLKRTIQRYLEDPLSEELISGRLKNKKVIKIGCKNKELTFAQ